MDKEQLAVLEQQQYQIQHQLQQQYEHEQMDSEDQNLESSMMGTSVNWSGLIRIMKEDAASQTENDFHMIPQPPIRKLRDIDPRVKKACIKASVKCNMSTAMGLVAVHAVCEEMYDHHYYLSKEEAIQNDPYFSQHHEQQQEQNENMPCAKKMRWSNQKNKPPSNKEDYIPYQNVLPSAKTLNEYKLMLAVQEETEAANALFNIPESVKCTLHYDTTSRGKIDGDWPSIMFSFSNNRRFVLCPLFFAFEDGTNC